MSPCRVFLVEDHPTMRKAYAQVLEREADIELCGAAESAEDLLSALDTITFDVLVTDLSLPGIDGFELVRRLALERPDVPCIVISAHDGGDVEERSREAGARSFLSKRDITARLVPTILENSKKGAIRGSPDT